MPGTVDNDIVDAFFCLCPLASLALVSPHLAYVTDATEPAATNGNTFWFVYSCIRVEFRFGIDPILYLLLIGVIVIFLNAFTLYALGLDFGDLSQIHFIRLQIIPFANFGMSLCGIVFVSNASSQAQFDNIIANRTSREPIIFHINEMIWFERVEVSHFENRKKIPRIELKHNENTTGRDDCQRTTDVVCAQSLTDQII